MHVAIRIYDDVKSPDEAAAKVQSDFLPIISAIPGFSEYYAVRTGDTTMASVSVFKNKPADESVQAATKWIQQNMSRYLPTPPKMTSGETFAHTFAGTKKAAA